MAQSQTPMTICKKQRLAQYRIFIRIETGPVSHRLYYKSYNAQLWLPNADDIMLMVQSKLYLSSGLLVFSNISQNICKDWGKLPCWYILQASNILRFYSWQDFRMLLSIQLYLMINYELLFGISMGVLSFYYFVYLKLTEI